MNSICFLYGPPGSGKSTLGQALAERLGLPFIDLDRQIEVAAGRSVSAIFSEEGEAGFRQREAAALRAVVTPESESVVALGGGALLDPACRALAEGSGRVVCLDAPVAVLAARLTAEAGRRPLIAGETAAASAAALAALLERRAAHYDSFGSRLDAASDVLDDKLREASCLLGRFRVGGMGAAYDVRVGGGELLELGVRLRARGGASAVAVVADRNTAPYGETAVAVIGAAGLSAQLVVLEAGEAAKTPATLGLLWDAFRRAGLDRDGVVVAVGGGVVGDLAGLAAATWLRGVRWVGVPTTLLAMVDSSLGGKTAADLPEGKNLIGAFHAPMLVLADTDTLATLPPVEMRCGLAEVIKHGVLGDPALGEAAAAAGGVPLSDYWVARAMAVKIAAIEADPFERSGARAALNLGHTVGHALEQASHYRLRHGEAVAIGLVAEARLAERLGMAEPGFAERLAALLAAVGLPTERPADIALPEMLEALRLDKKRAAGQVRFVLPLRFGAVRSGVAVDEAQWTF